MKKISPLEAEMMLHIRAHKLPNPEREYRFAPDRRWRFDFAWPDKKVALEVEGGIWTNGRHNRGAGMEADMEKYNRATCEGWRLLRVGAGAIKSGEAVVWVAAALGMRQVGGGWQMVAE